MKRTIVVRFLCLVLAIGVADQPFLAQSAASSSPSVSQATAPSNQPGSNANVPLQDISVPVPRQIRTAKRVFISNAGDQTNLFPDVYSGGPDRPYVQFYAAMQNWGHYQLVSSPEKADLVFQIGLVNPIASELLPGDNAGYWNGAEWHDPQLRLNILDPRTRISLWKLTSHIQSTMRLKASRDTQFDLAMSKLVAEVEQLSTETDTTENSSLLREKGHSKSIKIWTAVAIGAAAAGVASFAVMASHNNKLPPLPPPPTSASPIP